MAEYISTAYTRTDGVNWVLATFPCKMHKYESSEHLTQLDGSIFKPEPFVRNMKVLKLMGIFE